MDLTAVITGSKEGSFLNTGRYRVRCCCVISFIRHGVSAGVTTIGNSLLHSLPIKPFGNVAVFEVKEDFAALTEGNGYGDGSHIRILVGSGHGTAGDGLIGGRIIHKALHGARCHGEIIGGSRCIHLSAVVHGVNGEVCGFTVRNGLFTCGECDRIGVNNGNVDGTYDLVLIKSVYGHGAQSTVRGEYAVNNSAEAVV